MQAVVWSLEMKDENDHVPNEKQSNADLMAPALRRSHHNVLDPQESLLYLDQVPVDLDPEAQSLPNDDLHTNYRIDCALCHDLGNAGPFLHRIIDPPGRHWDVKLGYSQGVGWMYRGWVVDCSNERWGH